MFAILRRELSAYFTSPIGYIYLSVFYIFSGYQFVVGSIYQDTVDMTGVFSFLSTLILFLVPILTMRLLSEDNKNRTDQALLTAPISLTGLVLGKFFAAFIVFLLGLGITGLYTIIIATFARPDYAMIFGNFLAMLFMGSAMISIGMLISAMTENQVIAAVGGFAVGLFLLMMDVIPQLVTNQLVGTIINAISFNSRYNMFMYGIFDVSGIVFFFSVCAVFIFLTVRVLEKRRWS